MIAYPMVVPQVLASRKPHDGLIVPASARQRDDVRGDGLGDDSDLWLYRDRTVGLLRRYMRLSVEVGRLPSLLGREFFRTRVTSYRVSTFEDAVIFVYDVERSLEKLDPFEQKLIATLALQDYSQEQAAHLLNCGRRTVVRRYPQALDNLSGIFLEVNILTRLPGNDVGREKACQGEERSESRVSQTIHGVKIS